MRLIGFPDEFVPAGTSAEFFSYYRITAQGMAIEVKKLPQRRT
jgi:transketolase C-terminal domain/subunit